LKGENWKVQNYVISMKVLAVNVTTFDIASILITSDLFFFFLKVKTLICESANGIRLVTFIQLIFIQVARRKNTTVVIFVQTTN